MEIQSTHDISESMLDKSIASSNRNDDLIVLEAGQIGVARETSIQVRKGSERGKCVWLGAERFLGDLIHRKRLASERNDKTSPYCIDGWS